MSKSGEVEHPDTGRGGVAFNFDDSVDTLPISKDRGFLASRRAGSNPCLTSIAETGDCAQPPLAPRVTLCVQDGFRLQTKNMDGKTFFQKILAEGQGLISPRLKQGALRPYAVKVN